MRYRVTKDFVLEGTLLAWGDSLYLQQGSDDKWEVYSLFSRKLVGNIEFGDVKTYLTQVDNPPKGKYLKRPNVKALKDIPLVLLMFILPLWGIAQQKELPEGTIWTPNEDAGSPIHWITTLVQTGDNIYQLHVAAAIDSNYFLYPLNNRKKCELCPIVKLEPSTKWELVEEPDLYSYGAKLPVDRCGSLPSPYCPVERYTGSVVYICVCRVPRSTTRTLIKGIIEYYPTHKDSTGQMRSYRFTKIIHP